MKVLNNGHFALTLDSKDLLKGIRKHSTQPRNQAGFVSMKGVKGKDGALVKLQAQDFNDSRISGQDFDNFPWPQIFRFDKHIIICNEQDIREFSGVGFNVKISGLTASLWPWYAAASSDWIYFSNGKVSVVRNPETQAYSLSSSAPVGIGICNYNGQIIVGDQQINF